MAVYTERKAGSPLADFVGEHAQVLSIAMFFLLCMAIFGMASSTFLSAGNLLNILRQAAPILIVAVAMTMVITTAGIDLSVGSQVALVNAVCAIALGAGLPWPVVVLLMLALGAGVGAVQGWFISYQGIPAFIVTLAGLSILRGFALYLTEGYSIPITDVPGFFWLGRGALGVGAGRLLRRARDVPAGRHAHASDAGREELRCIFGGSDHRAISCSSS